MELLASKGGTAIALITIIFTSTALSKRVLQIDKMMPITSTNTQIPFSEPIGDKIYAEKAKTEENPKINQNQKMKKTEIEESPHKDFELLVDNHQETPFIDPQNWNLKKSIFGDFRKKKSYNLRILQFNDTTSTTNKGKKNQRIPGRMSIWVDVSLLQGILKYRGGKGAYNVIVNYLIPSCVEHISTTYEVYKKSKIKLYSSRCGDIDSIGPYYNKVIDGDLVIFIYYVNKNMGAVAYASSCQYDKLSGRPIAGQVVINLFHMNDFRKSNFENNFMTVLHEMHHVLGFSPFFFTKFVQPNTLMKIPKSSVIQDFNNGPFIKRIVMPPVVEWGRKHFNCPSLMGVPVENTGGRGTLGSHWDKAIAANELMGPTDYSNPIFGPMTMKFMEGTGWYKVNYSMAEDYYWARGSGCGIFSGQCSLNPMTCGITGRKMCSYDYYAIGRCREDSYAEACPIFAEASRGDCRFSNNKNTKSPIASTLYYGVGARCIMGKIGAGTKIQYTEYPNCLRAKCRDKKTVIVQVEGQTVTCTKSNQIMNYKLGSSRYIRCPDIADFCGKYFMGCLNECSHNGRCLKSRKCWCFVGFTGADCSRPQSGRYVYNTLGKVTAKFSRVLTTVISLLALGVSLSLDLA